MNGTSSPVTTAALSDPAALAGDLRVVHASFGRLRVHLPRWSGKGGRHITAALRRITGVTRAEANHVTNNVLIVFNPRLAHADRLLAALRGLRLDLRAAPEPDTYDTVPAVIEETVGRHQRARIPVRGLDRDPGLARRVIQQLESAPGVQAQANPLTGRVTV